MSFWNELIEKLKKWLRLHDEPKKIPEPPGPKHDLPKEPTLPPEKY